VQQAQLADEPIDELAAIVVLPTASLYKR